MRRFALVLLALLGCYGLAEGQAGVLVAPPRPAGAPLLVAATAPPSMFRSVDS